MGNDRRLYARSLAAGINHFNQAQILFNLLASGRETAPAPRAEGRVGGEPSGGCEGVRKYFDALQSRRIPPSGLFVVEVGLARVVAIDLASAPLYPLLTADLQGDFLLTGASLLRELQRLLRELQRHRGRAKRRRLYLANDTTNQVLAFQLVLPRGRR